MPERPARVPPARLVRAVDRARTALQTLNRRMVPGNVALLELSRRGAHPRRVRRLLARAGFRLSRVVETATPMMSIVKAVPA